ncbi:hypothetical protein DM01DRAFT_1239594 [Hesseltinella vesiculosa]|uniref:Uncharacterized protein n=1 Tax=Hesseltinella vesiculosa TaxID=101127 RepID=A0A1X2GM82_9FUNG|nr:hypothetical protein DM01DRAFT_1239594 [Hesseltinella vesiculosa]
MINISDDDLKALAASYLDMDLDAMFENLPKRIPTGLKESTKAMFSEVIKDGMNEDGILDRQKIDIAILERKLTCAIKGDRDSEAMQILCILEHVVRDTIEPGYERPVNRSELTCYRQTAKLLDFALCDQPLELLDSEIISKSTAEVARQNAKIFGVNNVTKFGRRIDLIVSSNATDRVELSTNEWKREAASYKVLCRQRSKNARSNKAIVKNLRALPLKAEHVDKVYSIAMDWDGKNRNRIDGNDNEVFFFSNRLGRLPFCRHPLPRHVRCQGTRKSCNSQISRTRTRFFADT